jgi:hypothetical protein
VRGEEVGKKDSEKTSEEMGGRVSVSIVGADARYRW